MLALPLSTAGAGFPVTLLLLITASAVSLLTSLLVLEVLSKSPSDITNFSTMSFYTLGKPGQYICLSAYLIMLYSVSCAFVSGAGSMMAATLGLVGFTPPMWLLYALYSLVVASVVHCGHHAVDKFTRVLFSLKGISFLFLCLLLLPEVKLPYLLDTAQSFPYIWIAIPVIFFSFGLQIVVPSVYLYLEKDAVATARAIRWGCLMPFVMYFVWLLITLGVLPRMGEFSYAAFLSAHSTNNIGDFFFYLEKGSRWVTLWIAVFANVAIATSYNGVAMALRDFLVDTLKWQGGKGIQYYYTLVVFLPTLMVVAFAGDIFHAALNFSAAMIVIVLIFLPLGMVIAIRKRSKKTTGKKSVTARREIYTAPFSTLSFVLLGLAGVTLFVVGLMASFGRLPVLTL